VFYLKFSLINMAFAISDLKSIYYDEIIEKLIHCVYTDNDI